MEAVDLDELERLLERGAEVIDVRERDERDGGYIAGQPEHPVPARSRCTGDDLPTDRPVVTICESGARAAIAASHPRGEGHRRAARVLDGGVAAGLPAAAGRSSSAAVRHSLLRHLRREPSCPLMDRIKALFSGGSTSTPTIAMTTITIMGRELPGVDEQTVEPVLQPTPEEIAAAAHAGAAATVEGVSEDDRPDEVH